MIFSQKAIGSFVSCLLLAGCAGRSVQQVHNDGQYENAGLSHFKAFHDQDSRAISSVKNAVKSRPAGSVDASIPLHFFDIPIPLKSSIYREGDSPYLLTLLSAMECDEILLFYKHEMEREGWGERIDFLGDEPLLIFKKPDKWAVITIRQHTVSYWQTEPSVLISIRIAQS